MKLELLNHTWKITFPFDRDLIDRIKQVPGRKWSVSDKAWYVPDSTVTRCFMKHHLKIDIDYKKPLPEPEFYAYSYKYQMPFKHQIDAIDQVYSCIKHNVGLGLFAETGTGKTKIILETIRKFTKFIVPEEDHFLVICPAPLIKVWEFQAEKHEILYQTVHGKRRQIGGRTQIYITSYQTFVRDCEKWKKEKIKAVICDESHLLKTQNTNQTLAVKSLPFNKIFLTGTPYGNKLEDLFCQVNSFSPESFGSRKVFYDAFCVFGGWEDKEIVGYKNLNIFWNVLKQVSLVIRKADCLDLPEKIYQTVELEKGKKQSEFYRRCEVGGILDMPVSTVLTKIIKLRQISSGFVYTDSGETLTFENPKLQYLESITYDTPTIIWVNFVEEENQIVKLLNDKKIRFTTVKNANTAHHSVEMFESGNADVIVANLASIQYGYTLNRTRRVIYFSPSFSQLQRSQSEDRCHRIGQTANVQYIDLCCSNIEKWIIDAREAKIDAKDYCMKKLLDMQSK